MPSRQVAWAGLIAVELTLEVAVALGSDAAAYAAACLMAMFAALTVAALLRGRAGHRAHASDRDSLSWFRVLRTLLLPRALRSPRGWLDPIGTQGWMWIGIGVALAACAALTVAVLALAREVGMLRLQVGTQGALEIAGEGPEIGSRVAGLAERRS